MYSSVGWPSIPPERLLKSMVLIALYSVRSDRLFCERLDHDMLFRWFLDMNLEESSFDASSFSKNRERLLEHAVRAASSSMRSSNWRARNSCSATATSR